MDCATVLVPGRTRVFAPNPAFLLDDTADYLRNARTLHTRNTIIRQIADMLSSFRFEELHQTLAQLESDITATGLIVEECLELLRAAEEQAKDIEQEQLSIILQQQQLDEEIELLNNEKSRLLQSIQLRPDYSVPEYDSLIAEENKIKIVNMNGSHDYCMKMDILAKMKTTLREAEESHAQLSSTLSSYQVDIPITNDQDTEILESIVAAKQFAYHWLSASKMQMELQLIDTNASQLHELEMKTENKQRENDLLESKIGEMKIQNGTIFAFTGDLLREVEALQEGTNELDTQREDLQSQRKKHDDKIKGLNDRLDRMECQHDEVKQMVQTKNDFLFETIEANDCQLMKEDEKIRELEQENYDLTNQIKLVKARIIVVNKKLAKIGVE